jgi:DNA invertase Pin-like site-specific DNA recombinase
MIPVALLVRVSTSRQDTDRQEHELREVAERAGWSVVATIRQQVSGASRHRPDIEQVLALAQAGEIQKVLVHEVSRLGRRPALVHGTVEKLHDAGASLYWHSQRIETLLPDGRRNPAAGIMLAVMAEMAQAERETLIERINSGLAEARRKGKALGRPAGTTMDRGALLAKHADVVRQLKAGKSVRDVAAITGKGTSTVKRVKKAMA